MATNPNDIQLTSDQRQLIAQLADETGKPWPELLRDFAASAQSDDSMISKGASRRTMYDAFAESGLIGCVRSGTGDLSTNPGHMEGFGEDVWPTGSD